MDVKLYFTLAALVGGIVAIAAYLNHSVNICENEIRSGCQSHNVGWAECEMLVQHRCHDPVIYGGYLD